VIRDIIDMMISYWASGCKFLDGVVEHVDRIKALINIDRPSLRFVNFDKCEEYVKLVTFLGALGCAPAGVDLGERCPK